MQANPSCFTFADGVCRDPADSAVVALSDDSFFVVGGQNPKNFQVRRTLPECCPYRSEVISVPGVVGIVSGGIFNRHGALISVVPDLPKEQVRYGGEAHFYPETNRILVTDGGAEHYSYNTFSPGAQRWRGVFVSKPTSHPLMVLDLTAAKWMFVSDPRPPTTGMVRGGQGAHSGPFSPCPVPRPGEPFTSFTERTKTSVELDGVKFCYVTFNRFNQAPGGLQHCQGAMDIQETCIFSASSSW